MATYFHDEKFRAFAWEPFSWWIYLSPLFFLQCLFKCQRKTAEQIEDNWKPLMDARIYDLPENWDLNNF